MTPKYSITYDADETKQIDEESRRKIIEDMSALVLTNCSRKGLPKRIEVVLEDLV